VPRTVPILLTLTAAAVTLPGSDNAGFRLVEIYGGRLEMEVPADWTEIEPEHLDELTTRAADVTAGRLVEVYQHGFRPSDLDADPLLPALMVQIRESGRLRFGSFVHLQPLDELRDDARKRYPNGLPPLLVGVAVDRVVFDRKNFSLRMEHSLDLRFKGRVTILTAAFLTEKGFVTLHYADRERYISDGRRVLDRIVGSVRLSSEIAYRPTLGDRWPGLPFFAAAAFVAAALLVYIFRRGRGRR
jgi:hypothetical protein